MKFRSGLAVLGFVFTSTACAAGSLGSRVPIPDPDRAESRARRDNPNPNTLQVVFQWSIREPDLQIDGRGFARLQSPDRARFDLFMDNNERVLAATLVGDEMCSREERALEFVPSPALLWASLGVFRPGEGVTRLGAEAYEDGALGDYRLTYRLPDGDELRYEIRSRRMSEVDLRHDGSLAHSIDLTIENGRQLPGETTYRNLAAFSRLRVTVESVESMDSFPSDIWYSVC